MTFAAALPAIASALPGILGMFGGGGGDKLKKMPTMSPQQEQLFNMLLGGLGGQGGGLQNALGLLQGYLDPQSEVYKGFEEPYMRQFQEETIPMLAERFAGGAQGGALSSSGFGQALGGAGAQLQSNLAGLKSGIQQNALAQLLNLTQLGLSKEPFAYVNKQKGGGGLTSFLGGLSSMSPGTWGDIGGGIQSSFQNWQGNKLINMAQGIKG